MKKTIMLTLALSLILAGCSLFGGGSGGEGADGPDGFGGEPIAEEFRGGWECEETTLEDPNS